MKKILLSALVAAVLAVQVPGAVPAQRRGGVMGFIAGCCFGVRTAAAYNEGKEIHWREWVLLIPVANIVFSIWNGIDGANGWTTKDFAAQYGSAYY